jgi:hypothetical protein
VEPSFSSDIHVARDTIIFLIAKGDPDHSWFVSQLLLVPWLGAKMEVFLPSSFVYQMGSSGTS